MHVEPDASRPAASSALHVVLLLASASAVGACGVGRDDAAGAASGPKGRSLQTVFEPLSPEPPTLELGPDGRCLWLPDGRLFVDWARVTPEERSHLQVWVEFGPPHPPGVELSVWGVDSSSGTRWEHRAIRGRAWIDSDGTGLAQPGGPDLTIEVTWREDWILADKAGHARIPVSAERLEQALGDARPPGAFDLTPSRRSLLQIPEEPLAPSDTVRRLDDGRLFVERTRKRRLFRETLRLWIDDRSEGLPRVRAALWKDQGSGSRPSTIGILHGRSWVRSPVEPSGPGADLLVELDLTVGGPISADPLELSLAVPAARLVR